MLRLKDKLKVSNENGIKLQSMLDEANNKFERLETLLHSTQAELSVVKTDLVNLERSKADIIPSVNDSEYNVIKRNQMLKKMLSKIFKQIKATFTENTEQNLKTNTEKTYSGLEVVDILTQHFRDVAQHLNSAN